MPVAYRRSDALHGVGVTWSKVKAHHVSVLPVCHQLEADDVRAVLLV